MIHAIFIYLGYFILLLLFCALLVFLKDQLDKPSRRPPHDES